jgi:hypothetical protein
MLTVAGHTASVFHFCKVRVFHAAAVNAKGTSCVKPAALGRVNRARDIAGKDDAVLLVLNIRDWNT